MEGPHLAEIGMGEAMRGKEIESGSEAKSSKCENRFVELASLYRGILGVLSHDFCGLFCVYISACLHCIVHFRSG